MTIFLAAFLWNTCELMYLYTTLDMVDRVSGTNDILSQHLVGMTEQISGLF